MQETPVQSLGREDPLEKERTTHSSILAWGIPWTEEAGGLQSMGSGLQFMGSQIVRHDLATKQQQYIYTKHLKMMYLEFLLKYSSRRRAGQR